MGGNEAQAEVYMDPGRGTVGYKQKPPPPPNRPPPVPAHGSGQSLGARPKTTEKIEKPEWEDISLA